jgi:hypothetical protein
LVEVLDRTAPTPPRVPLDLRSLLESSAAVLAIAGVAAFLFGRGYESAYYRELGVLPSEVPTSVEGSAFRAAVPLSVFVFLGLVVAFNRAGVQRGRLTAMALAVVGLGTGLLFGSFLAAGSLWGSASSLILISPSVLWLIAFWLWNRGSSPRAALCAVFGFVALLLFVPDLSGQFRARADKAGKEVGEAVTVQFHDGGGMEGGLLGTTSEFLLLWTEEEGLVRVPTDSVSMVRSK